MTEPTVRSSLSTPMTSRRPRISFDSDAVGRYSEAVARFFGTGMYLLIQTVVVIVWIVINVAVVALRFDPYPFILLNLAFSTQAAYAAPLILLAQNRQEDRDKESVKEDRLRATQTKADTEFLARELASVRLSVGETVTRDYLRRELDDLRDSVERIETMLAGFPAAGGNADGGETDPDDRGRG
ncbi:hypothetical protein C3V38_15695 [Dietzia sp. oral taxon 368]|uniref:DUF1003 domain-containing protein n=1 Tax=Dietzia sp. oral taxon 368 TaxID=712270 RepID=UPI000D08FE8F|nr:DUF1003 domain-containing protein [Dietzia sp. oral taxon 368]AVM65602.1 hypothetical protein C3V38_15695 [Dietzia sp. oral taxon 368]